MMGGGIVVGLVTWSGLPGLHEDDFPLVAALEARGVTVRRVVWDDPGVDWASLSIAVLRSTWDYHNRIDEFLGWVARAGALTRMWNPPALVQWNADKRYLRALEGKGIRIVPTEWAEPGARLDIAARMEAQRWEKVVVKPAVSGGGWRTVLAEAGNVGDAQKELDALLADGRIAMLQRYMPAVAPGAYGERSILCIDGVVTHSVKKNSHFAPRDAEADPVGAPGPDEVAFAREVLGKVELPFLYARVDIVPDDAQPGDFRLMELEMTEPTLFLRESAVATERLADGILKRAS